MGRIPCDSEFGCDDTGGDGSGSTGSVEVVGACQALFSEVTVGRLQYVQSSAFNLFHALVLPLLLMTLALPFRIYFPLIVTMVSLPSYNLFLYFFRFLFSSSFAKLCYVKEIGRCGTFFVTMMCGGYHFLCLGADQLRTDCADIQRDL